MKKLFIFLLAVVLTGQLAPAGSGRDGTEVPGKIPPVIQVNPERSPGLFNPEAFKQKQDDLFKRLMAEHVFLDTGDMVRVQITREELEEIWNYRCEECGKAERLRKKIRCGVVKGVDFAVDFQQLTMASLRQAPRRHAGGIVHATADGGFAWNTTATSPEAAALRVHFGDFHLPPGIEIYIYNDAGAAFGPYTLGGPQGSGDFWSHTTSGPLVNIQVRSMGPASDRDLHGIRFTIEDLGHITPRFTSLFKEPPGLDTPAATEGLCPDNAWCVEDASCYSGNPVDTLKDAVAHMQWVAGAWIYYCSGGLLADTVPETQIPYFLSAHHCVSKSKDAKNLECYFQYKTASCGGPCYDPVGVCPRTLGADILSANRTSDFSLMRLWEDPPAGSAFLGWTTAVVAFSHGYNLYRVSHPQGSPQGYSEHYVDTDKGVCSSWPRGAWIYSTDTLGATEGGSSGSPVTNGSAQVVGQLTGVCGTNIYDVCDYESNATVDGAFANYFDAVRQWLDPDVTCQMHVDYITLSVTQQAVFYRAVAEVKIVNADGQPLANATVTGTFTGDVTGTQSGFTDGSGVVILQSAKQKDVITGFAFCVDSVTHDSCTYDPGANVETCDTY